ncbi:MAG: ABC transporter permease [Cyclobacteriaceae bacterium]|nr:ABC transporter permease [Cyclobacteriaceae bacterium]
MNRLLKIEFSKLLSYRTFWILIGIYFVVMGITTMSGMEFLKWLAEKGAQFGEVNIMKVPLYHFPDIWQNLTYVAQYFRLLLGIFVIISITNEFSYKTIRQNVIDGLSRADFIASKVLIILGISIVSTVFVFLIGILMGSIYSPESEMRFMFKHIDFIPAFFLATFNYLLLVMVIALIVKRAGLSIVIVLVYPAIEFMIEVILPGPLEFLTNYLPYHALSNLIDVPFGRYIFLEIRDSVAFSDIALNLLYIPILIWAGYQTIAKKNLS